ncbi:4-hydroxy-tetrahydrodipicolinate synthase family protein [Rhodopseudomonas sp. P2A-2r]|uniref:4-hydroxy-tetrahydrodipicolinate synthase family protein n=1 Tax=unclassified Rhodopseudomonas TaxID=2638247 RepID=UPI002234BB9D|nr:4-hydroxy-tetrahydrodipicolinate synthase [Rhodopseudomonas sp. P2A-2r]UZE50354.1 4-hydroxy-tetrahydrodipicolinate synthase [Rhodopseudomonas sp. P2A-2r]
MPTASEPPSGLWLPLITPFRDGAVDLTSLRRLLDHYADQPVDGFILGATTGEGMTLDEDELRQLATTTAQALQQRGVRRPLYLGLSGSDTSRLAAGLARTASWPVDGYLIASPYYSRPSQRGLLQHFEALADSTARPIMLYNIPYRTGVNLDNATILRLAERSNIVGIKDCAADTLQSVDLLRRRPSGFAVLTGEDALFYGALIRGCDGGILASAHLRTPEFAALRPTIRSGDALRANMQWRALSGIAALLFAEPSPAPLKYWLWRCGLIDSPEVRLPMTAIEQGLAAAIDQYILRSKAEAGVPEKVGIG